MKRGIINVINKLKKGKRIMYVRKCVRINIENYYILLCCVTYALCK